MAAEKVTESVTGPPSISVSQPPTTQLFIERQAQQNNTLPLSAFNKQLNPPVQVKHNKMMLHPLLAHNKHPNPPIKNRFSRMLLYHLLPHNKYPTYIEWDRCHRVPVSLQHPTLPTPGSNCPVLPEEQ